MLNSDTRKRQRRQAAGALVSGLFQSNNNNGTAAGSGSGSGHSSISGAGGVSGGGGPTTPKSGGGSAAAAGVGSAASRKSTAQPRPSIQIPPRGIGPVYNPNRNDVLCGRGGRINAHSGNIQFRELVQSRKTDYLSEKTKKLEKAHIAAAIVRQVRDLQPSGRFLKEDPDGSWYDIGDGKAIKKVGQALREDAPDVRQEMVEGGSDDEDNSVGNNHINVAAPVMTVVPLPPPASDTITPRGTLTVSGRGGKAFSTIPRGGGGTGDHAYQQASQPIMPSIPANIVSESTRGGGVAPKGFSGAAAAAMLDSEYMPAPTARDVAFGREFHMADSLTIGGSAISGMSGPGGGGGGTMLSGMSGISALTDPSLLGGTPTSHRGGTSGSLRMSQLNQLRQQWAAQHLQQHGNSMNTDTSRLLLSSQNGLGPNSLQGSFQQMQLRQRQHSLTDGAASVNDNMSWADHSLIGGGLEGIGGTGGIGAALSNHGSGDNASVGNFSAMQHSVATGQSLMGAHSLASVSMTSKDDSWFAGRYFHPAPAAAPPPQAAAQFMQVHNNGMQVNNNGASDISDRSRSTGSRSTPQQRNYPGGSINSGGESVSMQSILSDLSENLIALDLAGTHSLLD